MGARLYGRTREGAGRRLEDEVELVVGVEREARELCRRVGERVGDGREALAVAVDREVQQGRAREVELVPLEGDARLGRVADAQLRGLGLARAKEVGDVALEVPELAGLVLLGVGVAGAGDVDDAAGPDAGGEEERGELDEVDRLREV